MDPPNLMWLTSAHAEGETPLNAFDNALISAGIGHWNLVKVTSVAPQGALISPDPVELAAGSVVPAVLTSAESSLPGELVTACIGIGLSRDSHGMIMEHSGPGGPEEMEDIVRRMVEESFNRRELQLERLIVRSESHTVRRVGASIAAVILWWR